MRFGLICSNVPRLIIISRNHIPIYLPVHDSIYHNQCVHFLSFLQYSALCVRSALFHHHSIYLLCCCLFNKFEIYSPILFFFFIQCSYRDRSLPLRAQIVSNKSLQNRMNIIIIQKTQAFIKDFLCSAQKICNNNNNKRKQRTHTEIDEYEQI